MVMENDVLAMIRQMIEGRNDFLSRNVLGLYPHQDRAAITRQYMTNELIYLEMMNLLHAQNSQLQTAIAGLMTLRVPTSFMNPVPVVASASQIQSSLEQYVSSAPSTCAICQDSISSGGCRIRQCGHVYHRSCIENWFSTSVRCPVCRHDIREAGRPVQTSADEE